RAFRIPVNYGVPIPEPPQWKTGKAQRTGFLVVMAFSTATLVTLYPCDDLGALQSPSSHSCRLRTRPHVSRHRARKKDPTEGGPPFALIRPEIRQQQFGCGARR